MAASGHNSGRNLARPRSAGVGAVEPHRSGLLRRPSGQNNRPSTLPPPGDAALPMGTERPKTAPGFTQRRVARPLEPAPLDEDAAGSQGSIAMPRAYSTFTTSFTISPPPRAEEAEGADADGAGAAQPRVTHRQPPPTPNMAEQRSESPSQRVHQRQPPPQPVDSLDHALLTPRASHPNTRAGLRPARLSQGNGLGTGSNGNGGGGSGQGGGYGQSSGYGQSTGYGQISRHASNGAQDDRLTMALAAIARLESELADTRGERAEIMERAQADAKVMASAARSIEGNHGALGDAVRTLETQLAQ
ncbi:hypothetical protein T492DRAFT_866700, partial [Pavlovales sp. CCMP2436]